MVIKDKELWNLLLEKLEKVGEITFVRYYPYKSGPLGQDLVIAEDVIQNMGAIREIDPAAESEVVRIVELLLDRGAMLAGMPRENKSSVMCQIRKHSGEVITLYFSHYESQTVISQRIRSSSLGVRVP
jgi:hypothetical protein